MLIVESVIGQLPDWNVGERRVETIVMSHEELQKPHQKVTTKEGTELGISLSNGMHLHHGDVLFQEDARVIAVELEEEAVYEIRPTNSREWAKAAFNIGNMHQKAYLYEDCIRVPYDAVLKRLLEQLNIPYSIEHRRLDGELANVAPSMTHHHSHPRDSRQEEHRG